jgi:uncharacterized circularly permuted ATP-grasp superfamily protein
MFAAYGPTVGFDEYFDATLQPRRGLSGLVEALDRVPLPLLQEHHAGAERLLLRQGATFRLNSSSAAVGERILPFDPLPRLIASSDWDRLERGLSQRIEAIDQFLADLYGEQRIIADGVIPREELESSQGWRPQLNGFQPPRGRWCHISGLDLVRDGAGTWRVLEDNLRCPSGVSYHLENRKVMKRILPALFSSVRVRSCEGYPSQLLAALQSLASWSEQPRVVLLTPGVYNSAYYEHSYLATQMGIALVEGRDLFCQDGRVWMRTTKGPEPVDVIYRRIDDDFLDPAVFRSDSMLGVRGLMEVYAAGRVAIANAPGTGVADDKLIYTYVPEMIRYYLGEEPIIENVPTFRCGRPQERDHVLARLDQLVVKAVSEAGGYGMLIGPKSTEAQRLDFAEKIRANPRNYIAQPTLELSTVPSFLDGAIEPCHVDLRPYIVRGDSTWITPGGLTRVALRRGSLVVNSSQGGGSKDTWIVEVPEVDAGAGGPSATASIDARQQASGRTVTPC